MICKQCKNDVQKTPVIRKDVTRFVDAKGQLWNGATCPDCYREYNRERMKLTRANKPLCKQTSSES